MARGGGRGGGGGGGGRSGGFGGGRSSGGRSSSSGRGGGSWGSSSGSGWGSSNRGSSSWGSGNNSRPVIFNNWGSNRNRRYYGSGGGGGGNNSGCGCSSIAVIILFALVGIFIISSFGSGNSGGGSGSNNSITSSTIEREALPSGSVNETEYYTDEVNWIGSKTVMESGLRHFYQETGVQPHVYITDEINGSSNASFTQIEEFTANLYDELFTDEAHLLLLFYEPSPSDYTTYYVAGSQAKQVIDTEAADILLDYIDRYYYDLDLTEAEFFSKSFSDAADRIMQVTRSPWIPILLVFGLAAVVGVLFLWWKKRKEQEAIEAKRTEEILSRPIESFGKDSEADNLAKKYSDDNQ